MYSYISQNYTHENHANQPAARKEGKHNFLNKIPHKTIQNMKLNLCFGKHVYSRIFTLHACMHGRDRPIKGLVHTSLPVCNAAIDVASVA